MKDGLLGAETPTFLSPVETIPLTNEKSVIGWQRNRNNMKIYGLNVDGIATDFGGKNKYRMGKYHDTWYLVRVNGEITKSGISDTTHKLYDRFTRTGEWLEFKD